MTRLPCAVPALLLVFCVLAICLFPQVEARAEVDSGQDADSPVEAESEDVEASDEEPEDIGEIQVTETRVEGIYAPEATPTLIIEPDELERSALEDLTGLSRRSAFNIQKSHGGDALSLLGLNPKFTLILIDGQRIGGRIAEMIDVSQLPLLGIERIEVIRGPLATLYGSGAVAGVVNIVTKSAPAKPSGNYQLRSGSYGFNSETIEFGAKGDSSSCFLAYRRTQRSSFDLNPRNPATDGDAFLHQYLRGKLSRSFGNRTEAVLSGGFFDEKNSSIQTALGGISKRAEFDTERFELSLAITTRPNDRSKISLTNSISHYGHGMRTFLVNIEPSGLTEDRFRDELHDAELVYAAYSETSLWQAGVVRSRDHINSSRVLLGCASYWQNSFFINAERYFSNEDSLSLGLRVDKHQVFGSEVSPKFSYWKKAGKVDVRLGYGHGFRAPSLKELHFEWNSPFGYTVRGNPNLTPEITDTFILTTSYSPSENSYLDASLFYSNVKGMIVPTEVRAAPLVFKEINIAQAQTKGATVTFIFKPSGRMTANLDQTYTIAKDADTGNLLPQNPRYRGKLGLLYDFSERDQVEFVNTLVSPQYTSTENTRLMPGYYTLDVNFRLKRGFGDIVFNIRNLTDRVNRRYGPKPGREFFVSIERRL